MDMILRIDCNEEVLGGLGNIGWLAKWSIPGSFKHGACWHTIPMSLCYDVVGYGMFCCGYLEYMNLVSCLPNWLLSFQNM